MKEIKITLPMPATELEGLLHKVCDNGHWDECVVVCDDNAEAERWRSQALEENAALDVARSDIAELKAKIIDLAETVVTLKERIRSMGVAE